MKEKCDYDGEHTLHAKYSQDCKLMSAFLPASGVFPLIL